MPRGRPKKTLNKKPIPQTYNPLDFEHTGQAKFNPRNLFEEWNLTNLHKEDVKIDKKLYRKVKKATPRRPPVKNITVQCPFCHKSVEILETDANSYSFTIPNDSTFPTFKCDKCYGN